MRWFSASYPSPLPAGENRALPLASTLPRWFVSASGTPCQELEPFLSVRLPNGSYANPWLQPDPCAVPEAWLRDIECHWITFLAAGCLLSEQLIRFCFWPSPCAPAGSLPAVRQESMRCAPLAATNSVPRQASCRNAIRR